MEQLEPGDLLGGAGGDGGMGGWGDGPWDGDDGVWFPVELGHLNGNICK